MTFCTCWLTFLYQQDRVISDVTHTHTYGACNFHCERLGRSKEGLFNCWHYLKPANI